MAQKVLWTIRTTATLTVDLWQRFVTKTREAGTTPARVLEDFIHRYTENRHDDQDDARGNLRQGEHD
jgi:hypothetical protein